MGCSTPKYTEGCKSGHVQGNHHRIMLGTYFIGSFCGAIAGVLAGRDQLAQPLDHKKNGEGTRQEWRSTFYALEIGRNDAVNPGPSAHINMSPVWSFSSTCCRTNRTVGADILPKLRRTSRSSSRLSGCSSRHCSIACITLVPPGWQTKRSIWLMSLPSFASAPLTAEEKFSSVKVGLTCQRPPRGCLRQLPSP